MYNIRFYKQSIINIYKMGQKHTIERFILTPKRIKNKKNYFSKNTQS